LSTNFDENSNDIPENKNDVATQSKLKDIVDSLNVNRLGSKNNSALDSVEVSRRSLNAKGQPT
jgi:hypothetical protein